MCCQFQITARVQQLCNIHHCYAWVANHCFFLFHQVVMPELLGPIKEGTHQINISPLQKWRPCWHGKEPQHRFCSHDLEFSWYHRGEEWNDHLQAALIIQELAFTEKPCRRGFLVQLVKFQWQAVLCVSSTVKFLMATL